MSSIREYINIVEAGWWPSKKAAPVASPHSGMKGALKTAPQVAPRPASNVSAVVVDLKQAASQLRIRPNDEDATVQCETLTQGLLSRAAEAGMNQFVPTLQRILHYLSVGRPEEASKIYPQFFTAFDQLMQSGAY